MDGPKVYNVSAERALPDWMSDKAKKKYVQRTGSDHIQLLQDASFSGCCQRIKQSPDGQFLAATGVYPPQVKVYELNQLSMKFERHLSGEVVQFLILTDDYSKMAFLRADRTLEFHVRFGYYYKTRIPRFGRDLVYHPPSCDLFVGASGNEIYRMNLEQGRFLPAIPLKHTNEAGVNVCSVNPYHGLLAFGCESNLIEFVDPRSKQNVASLYVDTGDFSTNVSPSYSTQFQITSMTQSSSGLNFVAGTSNGHCLLYDMRSSRPLLDKEHQYGLPVISTHFHQNFVVSADAKIIKIWDVKSGDNFTNIETDGDIHDVCIIKDSGVILVASEQQKIQSYYVPSLGLAPRWCSFLDVLTEELDDTDKKVIYDDYKFVTREELRNLGATNMIGTPYLRAYMHGYFMDLRLYMKLKAVSDPFAYERYREERVQKLLEAKRATRISLAQRRPVSNKTKKSTETEQQKVEGKALDPRFAAMLDDEDYQRESGFELPQFKRKNKNKQVEQDDMDENEEEEEDQVEDEEGEDQGRELKFYEMDVDVEDEVEETDKNTKPANTIKQKTLAARVKTLPSLEQKKRFAKDRFGGLQMTFVPKSSEKKPQKNSRRPFHK